jgi:ribosomal protein S18 acetylase RimI-like enzyme
MTVNLICLEPEEAEKIALRLLATDPGSKFFRVFDRNSARSEACVLIESAGKYVGFSTITSDGSSCEIYRFFISPENRSRGLGTIAARELEVLLKADGYVSCFLQIDNEEKFAFWSHAIGPLMIGNETSNMYYKDYK